jgi:hypothetical protein
MAGVGEDYVSAWVNLNTLECTWPGTVDRSPRKYWMSQYLAGIIFSALLHICRGHEIVVSDWHLIVLIHCHWHRSNVCPKSPENGLSADMWSQTCWQHFLLISHSRCHYSLFICLDRSHHDWYFCPLSCDTVLDINRDMTGCSFQNFSASTINSLILLLPSSLLLIPFMRMKYYSTNTDYQCELQKLLQKNYVIGDSMDLLLFHSSSTSKIIHWCQRTIRTKD